MQKVKYCGGTTHLTSRIRINHTSLYMVSSAVQGSTASVAEGFSESRFRSWSANSDHLPGPNKLTSTIPDIQIQDRYHSELLKYIVLRRWLKPGYKIQMHG